MRLVDVEGPWRKACKRSGRLSRHEGVRHSGCRYRETSEDPLSPNDLCTPKNEYVETVVGHCKFLLGFKVLVFLTPVVDSLGESCV